MGQNKFNSDVCGTNIRQSSNFDQTTSNLSLYQKVPTIWASLMMELNKNLLDTGKAVLKLEEIMWKSDYAVVNKG